MSVELKKIVSIVESDDNQYAIRFEANLFYDRKRRVDFPVIDKIVKVHRYISRDTARMIFFSSWGKYQIMGFNLYRFYNQPIGIYLCDVKTQDWSFDVFIEPLLLKYSEKDILEALKFLIVNKVPVLELEKYQHDIFPLIKFVGYYNGAIFPSMNFKNYVGRMIEAYKKLTGGKA